MIPVLGFATLSRFDLAQRLLDSIDYPVENLVMVDNSGTNTFEPIIPQFVKNVWLLRMPNGLGANGAWNLIIKSTPHAPYWVIPNDDAYFAPGALSAIAEGVQTDKFNFVDVIPSWSCVIPTQGSVGRAGLWDESFHPIYFDDDDYHWRMKELGVEFHTIDAKVHHDNSSTINSGYEQSNARTYQTNAKLFQHKQNLNILRELGWSLQTRRENKWD